MGKKRSFWKDASYLAKKTSLAPNFSTFRKNNFDSPNFKDTLYKYILKSITNINYNRKVTTKFNTILQKNNYTT